MKKFRNISALVLVVLLLLQLCLTCGCRKGDEGGQPKDTTAADTTENPYDDRGFMKDSLPKGLKYGGKGISVLHWNPERPEFEGGEGQTGNNVVDAIYGRNIAIEERLGVKLSFEEREGDTDSYRQFAAHVEKLQKSGEYTHDIIAAYPRGAAVISSKGLLYDLNAMNKSYLDFDKPWWPERLIKNTTIGSSLYQITGDISTNTLHMMYGLYYNKDLLTDLGLPDPATEYVENRKWTIDRLIEMTKNQYEDLDGDGKPTEGDKYGFGNCFFHVDAFYLGAGLRMLEPAGDELIKISPDLFSQKTTDFIAKLGEWLTSADCYTERGDGHKLLEEVPFVEGRMLFNQNRVYIADDSHWCRLNQVSWLYGLLPTPMYDENQKDYITLLANPITMYSIFINAPDPEMASAVIECWASEAYRRTTPEIFEVNMKYKYTQEVISARIFDILRETSSVDLGNMFSFRFGPYITDLISKAAVNARPWTKVIAQNKVAWQRQVKVLITEFRK